MTSGDRRLGAFEAAMAKPAGPGQSAVGVVERDDVLVTKLHIPRPRKEFLSRPRLLERLTEGITRELVLVCTPAGSARPACWPTGPDAGGRWPGSRWTR